MTGAAQDQDDLSYSEQLALPFAEAAVRIDNARAHPEDRDAYISVLESNAALWLFFKNYIGEHFPEVSGEAKKFILAMSDFMVKAAVALHNEADEALIDKIVKLNFNMSESILSGKPAAA